MCQCLFTRDLGLEDYMGGKNKKEGREGDIEQETQGGRERVNREFILRLVVSGQRL